MNWKVNLILSVLVLAATVLAVYGNGRARIKGTKSFETVNIILGGTVISTLLLYYPLTVAALPDGVVSKTLLAHILTVFNTVKIFIADGEFSAVALAFDGAEGIAVAVYKVVFALILVVAPATTFGFVLSFFRNLSSYVKWMLNFGKDAFVFSELNEKSLALAESLKKNNPKKRTIVFTDVFAKEEEKTYELIARAEKLGAICFKKDVVTVRFKWHSKGKAISFFAIGEDYSENISQSLKLIEKYRFRENSNLYVFSTQVESELLLASSFFEYDKKEEKGNTKRETKIKVRRINEVQSLINRTLYDSGFEKIFSSATDDGSGVKKISAVIVGMGNHGTEMTKALSWFCQMDGYEVEINSFDRDKKAGEKFVSLCPELMSDEFNGKKLAPEETSYKITVHGNCDVSTKSFDDAIDAISGITYIFVALGNDEINISTAVKLRSLLARKGVYPEIQAVVYNSDKKEALQDIRNFKNQEYKIDFIGDICTSYSEKVILDSEVEEAAKEKHLAWGDEKSFWQYDYNYKSSAAAAIHKKMKVLCNMPGIELMPEEREENDRKALRMLEHRRWNAYMRAEGYVYGGTTAPEGRNDLAKMHNCLTAFSLLPLKEQIKDDV